MALYLASLLDEEVLTQPFPAGRRISLPLCDPRLYEFDARPVFCLSCADDDCSVSALQGIERTRVEDGRVGRRVDVDAKVGVL